MKISTSWLLTACILLVVVPAPAWPNSKSPMAMSEPAASAQSAAVAPVRIDHAWVRAAPPDAGMFAGYMDIRNVGKNALQLVSATSDTFGMVELHRSAVVKGVSTMTPAGAQSIAPGSVLAIHPGGLHFMLMGPAHPVKIGDSVRFTLHFADGSLAQTVAKVQAQPPNAAVH